MKISLGTTTLRVLGRNRDFRALWIGQACSALGDPIFPFAIAFLALDRGENAIGVGSVLAARALATVCATLVGGVFADRFRRTRIMIVADVVRLTVILAIIAVAEQTPLFFLALLVFVVGLGEAAFRPAYSAVVPALVPPEDRQWANAMTTLARRGGGIAGPAIAAALVAATSPQVALVVDAATFVISIAFLMLVREPKMTGEEGKAAPRRSFVADVREGFAAVVRRRWLAIEICAGTIQVTAALAPWLVLLPVVANGRQFGTAVYAGLLVAMSAGAVLGALVGARISSTRPGVVASLALLPFTLALVGLAQHWPFVVLLILHFAAGVGTEIYGVLWMTAIQRSVPANILGRVFAIDQLGSMALLPVGMVAAGALADAGGARTVLMIAAAVNLVIAVGPLVFADVRVFADRDVATEPSGERDAAATATTAAGSGAG
ncbi:MFS transporter [Streptomyces hirsutus]|uniref:MFS transporter n=1 Tax=Streptomyces hirsutus TaxID=35620 RepID=UPI003683B6E9